MPAELSCIILAGGLGTRLASVVRDVPKPMAPVAGRPFLEYLIRQSRAAGCSDIILCLAHLPEVIEEHFGDGSRFGIPIRYTRESEPAGTGGAIKLAAPLARSEPVLVMNGDSYCDADLPGLIAAHRQRRAMATLVVAAVEDAGRFGTVQLAGERIEQFVEKTGRAEPAWVSAGIYAMNRQVLDSIPADRPCSVEREIFPELVGRGLSAFRHSGPFIDIGTPESFEAAQTILPLVVHRGAK